MRIRWIAATVLIAAAACGSSVAAPRRHAGGITPAHCGPAAARTVTANARARIYVTANSVYGCTTSGHRSYLLGHTSRSRSRQSRIGVTALAGVVAGYAASQPGVDTFSTEVVVRRLDTGRTLHEVNAIKGTLGPEFSESVASIVVKADGAVAWIGDGGSILAAERATEVNRIDRRGEANLDSTAAGVIRGLKLRGSRLSWRHGNVLRSSTLL
jgi:hypothetical protein